jgi:citrate synthase
MFGPKSVIGFEMTGKTRQVKSRNLNFTKKNETRLWKEEPSAHNPYIASSSRCLGYDLFELVEKRSFVDVLYLLFGGELPTRNQEQLLESLMIFLINPGPRHAATRAAMVAGVGKTDPVHILPVSLGILGGSHLGAGGIEQCIRFFRKRLKEEPSRVANETISASQRPQEGDWHPLPGFGSRFGGIDEIPQNAADHLARLPGAGKALLWGCSLARELNSYNIGWLSTGVAAAVFSDLGFKPRAGAGLFQLLSAPGLLAHGLEMANKPITALPFPSDEDYIVEYGQD